MFWQTARFRIPLTRPLVMGIVNVTPDSFSDGGRFDDTASAVAHCERLCEEGADILDIGGASTRPGAAPISLEQERDRVLPVVARAVRLGVPISVDTSRPQLMSEVLREGADIVNDVAALRADGAEGVVAAHPSAGVCLMHMRGDPASMQQAPAYADVVAEVATFLAQRVERLRRRGIADERIAVDPGFGFGKTVDHNLRLQRALPELRRLGLPLLVGWSRKSTLGAITGQPVDRRLGASIGAALASAQAGANIVRVHDVGPTVDALKVWWAFRPEAGAWNEDIQR